MTISAIKLYHYPAVRSARVKWLLHELSGDNFAVQRIDLYAMEQYSEDYLKLNPNHNVPMLNIVLEDGKEFNMLESGAMLTLLADAYPEKRLSPPATPISPERADFLQMLYFGAAAMDMMLWQIRIHKHVLRESEADHRTIARYQKKFSTEVEPQLKARLQKTTFICGDAFSAVDCMFGHGVMWAQSYGLCADPIFDRYTDELKQRPAFAKAFSDLSEFTPQVPPDSPVVAAFTG